MTVFAVFKGAYSDRGLEGVFSTNELGQEYIDREKIAGDGEIDDHPIAYELDKIKMRETVIVRIADDDEADVRQPYGCNSDDDLSETDVVYIDWDDSYWIRVSFNPDKDVMIKAARDKLTAWKAREAGI